MINDKDWGMIEGLNLAMHTEKLFNSNYILHLNTRCLFLEHDNTKKENAKKKPRNKLPAVE